MINDRTEIDKMSIKPKKKIAEKILCLPRHWFNKRKEVTLPMKLANSVQKLFAGKVVGEL